MPEDIAEDDAQERRELKMWLAVRADLPISRGKLAIQAMHAAGWLHLIVARDNPGLMEAYLSDATPKICVKVKSAGQLERLAREAQAAGIPHYLVADAGRSEIPPGTKTVCLFGPAYRDDLPRFLSGLQVLKEQPLQAQEADRIS